MTDRESHMVDVTIRIDAANDRRLEDIVGILKSSGLSNVDVHTRFLIVNGTIAVDQVNALNDISGVLSVREDRRYRKQP